MGRSRRVTLRKTWYPAPGWPRPPRGFKPSGEWTPDPNWPSPPSGWTGWQTRHGRLIAAMVLALLGALSLLGTVREATNTDDTRALQQRGVTTSATVLQSTYDPNGGDPDGWTTDTVQFGNASGRDNYAVVHHHGDNHVEQRTGTLGIIYDPSRPSIAMSTQEYANSTPGADLTVAVVITAILIIGAVALFLMAFEFSKGTSPGQNIRP